MLMLNDMTTPSLCHLSQKVRSLEFTIKRPKFPEKI